MRILFICCFFVLSFSGFTQTYYVSNLNTHGSGSLRHTITNASSGATIKFDPSLLDNGSQTLVLDSNIIIDKDLTIKGLFNDTDSIFISGNNSTRIFQILNAGHIVLDSLILEDANTIGDGGGLYIYNTTSVRVTNSIIRNCLAGNGGGIFGYSDIAYNGTLPLYLHVTNTLINHNSAHNNGGGVYYSHIGRSPVPVNNQDIIPKRIQFDYSTISNNTTAHKGGGIYYVNRVTSMSHNSDLLTLYSALKINLNGCTIYNNQANEGGAIYNQINSAHLKAIKQLPGPAEHYLTTKINIINSTLSQNTALSYPEIYSNSKNQIGSQKIIGSNIITFGSSIINSTQQNAIEIGSTDSIYSLGYNIFSDSLLNGYVSTDWYGVTPEAINLGNLDCYGESTTPTLLPQLPSIAINNGNPDDISPSQTGSLFRRRDIGSSETCKSFSIDKRTEYNALLWLNDSLYNSSNTTATYTTTNAYNCDSIVFLDLEFIPLPEMNVYPNPIKKTQDLDIFLSNHINKKFTVQLTDLQGRIIQSNTMDSNQKKHIFRLSELNLNTGIYFLNNSFSKKSVKLIVQ